MTLTWLLRRDRQGEEGVDGLGVLHQLSIARKMLNGFVTFLHIQCFIVMSKQGLLQPMLSDFGKIYSSLI